MSDRPWHTFDSDGRCIAWRHDLPDGTLVTFAPDRPVWNVAPLPPSPNALVIVVAWPDGSPPEAPEVDERWIVEFAGDIDQFHFDSEQGARDYISSFDSPVCTLTHQRTYPPLVIRQEVKP